MIPELFVFSPSLSHIVIVCPLLNLQIIPDRWTVTASCFSTIPWIIVLSLVTRVSLSMDTNSIHIVSSGAKIVGISSACWRRLAIHLVRAKVRRWRTGEAWIAANARWRSCGRVCSGLDRHCGTTLLQLVMRLNLWLLVGNIFCLMLKNNFLLFSLLFTLRIIPIISHRRWSVTRNHIIAVIKLIEGIVKGEVLRVLNHILIYAMLSLRRSLNLKLFRFFLDTFDDSWRALRFIVLLILVFESQRWWRLDTIILRWGNLLYLLFPLIKVFLVLTSRFWVLWVQDTMIEWSQLSFLLHSRWLHVLQLRQLSWYPNCTCDYWLAFRR